jgi:Uma2 family endonuclease
MAETVRARRRKGRSEATVLEEVFKSCSLEVVPLTIQLPPYEQQTVFNVHRWSEILMDRDLARLPHRIETDRYGHILMSPPPAPIHGNRQLQIGRLLQELLWEGHAITECPVSTSDGVKAVDVAWVEAHRAAEVREAICLTKAPEICVEVLSPANSPAEIREKLALYFDAGAREVWICDLNGMMSYYAPSGLLDGSSLCPSFPGTIATPSND